MAAGAVKNFIYQWLRKNDSNPDYTYAHNGSKKQPGFECTLKVKGYNYEASFFHKNKKESQTLAAVGFVKCLLDRGQIHVSSLPKDAVKEFEFESTVTGTPSAHVSKPSTQTRVENAAASLDVPSPAALPIKRNAAPVLTPKQTAHTLSARAQKRGKTLKNVVCTPYKLVWPDVCKDVEDDIIQKFKRLGEEYSIKSVRIQVKLPKTERQKETVKQKAAISEESKNLRSQLFVGINSVTKSLEKDELRVCLVNRNAPHALHRHLVSLSSVRGCPAAAINNLEDSLKDVLGINRIVALGLKKTGPTDHSAFDDIVELVSQRCPQVELPWIMPQDDDSECTDQSDRINPSRDGAIVGTSQSNRLEPNDGSSEPPTKRRHMDTSVDSGSRNVPVTAGSSEKVSADKSNDVPSTSKPFCSDKTKRKIPKLLNGTPVSQIQNWAIVDFSYLYVNKQDTTSQDKNFWELERSNYFGTEVIEYDPFEWDKVNPMASISLSKHRKRSKISSASTGGGNRLKRLGYQGTSVGVARGNEDRAKKKKKKK